MRAYIDLQSLQGPFYERGIARYVAALTRQLLRSSPDAICGLGTNINQGPIPSLYDDLARHTLAAATTRSRWRDLSATADMSYVCPSAFEGMKPIADLWPTAVIESNAPLVAIVHDTIPLRFPEVFQKTREQRDFYTARTRLLRHADLFLTNSQCSADDLVADVGVERSRVSVIGTGIDGQFQPAESLSDARSVVTQHLPVITKPYVLNVTGWPDTKNALGFLKAIATLPKDIQRAYQFVLASRVPPETETLWRNEIQTLGLPENCVVITGFIPDEVLVPLYQCTELLVCPSLYEGFGMPVAEAAACGRPAICSNVSSLPEILDFEPATFNPSDPSDMAARMVSALTDETFRSDLLGASARAAKTHTWAAVAQRFTAALECAAFPAPRQSVPKRAALLLSLNQTINEQKVRLAVASARKNHDFVDVFGNGLSKDSATLESGVRLFPAAALDRWQSTADYDEILTV